MPNTTTREQAREATIIDGELLRQQTTMYDPQEVYRALLVLVLTPHVREYLTLNDPKALEQARRAVGLEAK